MLNKRYIARGMIKLPDNSFALKRRNIYSPKFARVNIEVTKIKNLRFLSREPIPSSKLFLVFFAFGS